VRILVTGSAGFIGFHLSKSLLIDGYEVLGIDNLNNYYDPELKLARLEQLKPYKNFNFEKVDISNRKSITQSFQLFNPNKVVNLAAQAGVRYSIENPYAYMESNLVGFLNIIELCRHNNVGGLIYASSSSVYGGNKKLPKENTRATVAVCYLTFALFQILTLYFMNDNFNINFFDYAIFWLLGVGIFIIVEKQLYKKIDDQKYSISFRIFLLGSGLLLLAKY